ncbi:MAG: hypothetical protein DRN90_00235 [Thermoproteota archaeon]|nr:MAG: hypothetical protein DRN90_00235 [Candidatus Korarchaeota archaeon]
MLKHTIARIGRSLSVSSLAFGISEAIKDLIEYNPRLYSANRDFLDVIVSSADILTETIREIWNLKPGGYAKTLWICFPNRATRHPLKSDICLRIRTEKHPPLDIELAHVSIDKVYNPRAFAWRMIYLDSPSREELERKCRDLLREERGWI